jgi:hypothetical protein
MDTSHFPVGSNIAWTPNYYNRPYFSTAKVIEIISSAIMKVKWDHWSDADGFGVFDLANEAPPHLMKD